MSFSRRVSLVLGIFSLLLLVWNIVTPSNEDHVVNVAEHFILTLVFGITFVLPIKVSNVIQVVMIFIAAWIAAFTGDLQPSGAIGTAAVVLAYTYSKFQPLSAWILGTVSTTQFLGALWATQQAGYTPLVGIGHAVLWAVLPLVGVWLLWQALYEFAEKMLKQNRELLEINKTLVAGGKDGPP